MFDIIDYISKTNAASSPEEVFALFQQAVGEFGFDRAIFGGARNDDLFRDRYRISVPAPIILNNYPADWTRHYLEKDYARLDPVFSVVPRAKGPVIWREIPRMTKLSRQRKLVLDQGEEAGLHSGISIPIHTSTDTFIVSIASSEKDDLRPQELLGLLRVLATQCGFAFNDLRAPQPEIPVLSKRETQCIQWLARGKSAWVTGEILGISEATVRFHLGNAFAKLDASNGTLAIVKAMRWGMIEL